MARPRTIPDATVHAAILRLILDHGEQAVAFSSVARATGLAGPTLVQRYGSLAGMIHAALSHALDGVEARLAAAEQAAPTGAKGAQILLKALVEEEGEVPVVLLLPMILRDAELRERARCWRDGVEAALALRLGGGARGREAAALLFAAWQGQRLWQGTGERGFRLKDAVRAVDRR